MLPVPRLAVSCPSCEWKGSGPPSPFSCFWPCSPSTARRPTDFVASHSLQTERRWGRLRVKRGFNLMSLQHWNVGSHILGWPKMSHCFEEFTRTRKRPHDRPLCVCHDCGAIWNNATAVLLYRTGLLCGDGQQLFLRAQWQFGLCKVAPAGLVTVVKMTVTNHRSTYLAKRPFLAREGGKNNTESGKCP